MVNYSEGEPEMSEDPRSRVRWRIRDVESKLRQARKALDELNAPAAHARLEEAQHSAFDAKQEALALCEKHGRHFIPSSDTGAPT